ncbi:tetratricopeptide repeat protein [Streptomyces sp. MCA2]|uniref:tetratricopeptide repeat protein n=1 Tax=Streptomyces sp. MCA2 TaxID=2944805 RepID=UPI0020225BAB|nr:tetratricopeptide repeat protein [Streptomyces sp. MCA2]MCL7494851.1 tetratricopeptide repeat protein [Streptomyces sp. MCA2]
MSDPVRWGVHPAPARHQIRHVEYVNRDIDTEFLEALKPGRFILLIGDSTAGKSRTAFEAAQRLLGDYRVLMPFDGNEAGIAHELVQHDSRVLLWLDDLDVFLAPPAISVRVIDEIQNRNGIVLATLRAERFNELSLREERSAFDTERLLVRNARQIMSRAEKFFLDRRWSQREISQADISSDPRLKNAVDHADEYGVAEYLAAGPQLYDEWRNAWSPGGHPRAAALVSAAIDFKRAGINKPVGIGVLISAHEHYLQEKGGMRLRPEKFEEAISWATSPLHATTSLLVPYEAGTYKAFDYLVDKIANSETVTEIPDVVWDEVLTGKLEFDFRTVGEYAAKAGRTDLAERAYRLAEGADPQGQDAFRLGYVFLTAGNYDQAVNWYTKSAENGNIRALANLGYVHARKRDYQGAERYFGEAAQKGDEKAALGLATLLLKQQRLDEADAWCSVAEEKGIIDARVLRADIYVARGDIDLAEPIYLEMRERFPHKVATGLGLVNLEREKYREAISQFETALKGGDHAALISMARCYSEMKDYEEAASVTRRYMNEHPEDSTGYFNLAFYLQRVGNFEEAEFYYRKAVDLGDVKAMMNLANLLSDGERTEEAEELYCAAIKKGDSKAPRGLAHLYRVTGRFSKAISILRSLIREGSAAAFKEMGRVQEDLGRTNLAILWLQKAVDLGDTNAGIRLGYIYERRGESKRATPYYRIAAEAGDAHAYLHLGMIFEQRRDIEKAKELYQQAFVHEDFEAASRLGRLCLRQHDWQSAKDWFLKGAEKGDEESRKILMRITGSDDR